MLLACVICGFFVNAAYAQFNHNSSAQIPVGNADFNGFATVDKKLVQISLGGGKQADIFIKFQSDPQKEPRYLGAFWSMPFFDSMLTKRDSNRYTWRPPNNGSYTFITEVGAATSKKLEVYKYFGFGNDFLNVSPNNGALVGDKKDSSRKYEFNKDGRLVKFCQGSGCDTFNIRYNSNGYPVGLYNASKNAYALELGYKEGLLSSMKVIEGKDEKLFKFEYSPCDAFTGDGKTKYKDLQIKALISITYPDGEVETFKYEAAGNQRRSYLKQNGETHAVSAQPANKITVNDTKENAGWILWDAQTGLVSEDSGGGYATRNDNLDKFAPDAKPDIKRVANQPASTRKSAISYKRPEHKYPEIYEEDLDSAIQIVQDPVTGVQRKYSLIGAAGPAFMKARKIETKNFGEKDWKMFSANVYDAKGRLVREIFANGDSKKYDYFDNTTEILKIFENDFLVFELEKHETGTVRKYFSKDGTVFEDKFDIKKNQHSYYSNGKFIESKMLDEIGRVTVHETPKMKKEFAYEGNDESASIVKEYLNGSLVNVKKFKNEKLYSIANADEEEFIFAP